MSTPTDGFGRVGSHACAWATNCLKPTSIYDGNIDSLIESRILALEILLAQLIRQVNGQLDHLLVWLIRDLDGELGSVLEKLKQHSDHKVEEDLIKAAAALRQEVQCALDAIKPSLAPTP